MNLTQELENVCEALCDMGDFNGVPVIDAFVEGEDQKRKYAVADDLSEEDTEKYITDYVCVTFNLDTAPSGYGCTEYEELTFDISRLENDFRQWLLNFVPVETIPYKINLDGSDTEFMKPGFGE